jgi:hypothetical protein
MATIVELPRKKVPIHVLTRCAIQGSPTKLVSRVDLVNSRHEPERLPAAICLVRSFLDCRSALWCSRSLGAPGAVEHKDHVDLRVRSNSTGPRIRLAISRRKMDLQRL